MRDARFPGREDKSLVALLSGDYRGREKFIAEITARGD